MLPPPDAARFLAASQRFQTFFTELQGAFAERESLLIQMALALLSREHVLVTGSPGTAKSQLTAAVLRRIVDEHTGQPSLYARQFTESTVQTDLIGPVDFKTLMETGRTAHFTDEGILGAVHAFLDEVFDGRDMLLRSALNVLQERELKEGTHITPGRIECAVMTTNRYLSEILETSRETLLAFIDRIAFVNFVPRGFAAPGALSAVLRRHAGKGPSALLEAPLTIQDLDALQSAVDATHLPDAACDALAALLDQLDRELTTAMRADPTFIPTRYLSTRTAVRCGRILRAACVFEKVFRDPERPLVVRHADFTHLRLHLLLSGPTPEAAGVLLDRENDPRERRQIATLRTEREAFERALARVPVFSDEAPPPPRSTLPVVKAPAPTPAPAAPAAPDPLAEALAAAAAAVATRDVSSLCQSARALGPMASTRDPSGDLALAALNDTMRALGSSVVAASLAPLQGDMKLHDALDAMARVAQSVESVGGSTRVHARRLRGRVLAMTETAASLEGALSDEAFAWLSHPSPPRDKIVALAEARLVAMESVNARRRSLLALGLEPTTREPEDAPWPRAVASLEEDLVALWDAALRSRLRATLASPPNDPLMAVITDLAPELTTLSGVESRLSALAERRSNFRARVLAARLSPLVAKAFREGAASLARKTLVERVDALSQMLSAAGLANVIAGATWLDWAAEALQASERTPSSTTTEAPPSYEGFYAMRRAELRTPITLTLLEVELRTGASDLNSDEADLAPRLASLSPAVRARVAALDLARIERALAYLNRWCDSLTHDALAPDAAVALLKVARDESTLLRLDLEARILGEALPEHHEASAAVRGRIRELHARVRARVLHEVQRGAEAAWAETLAAPSR